MCQKFVSSVYQRAREDGAKNWMRLGICEGMGPASGSFPEEAVNGQVLGPEEWGTLCGRGQGGAAGC